MAVSAEYLDKVRRAVRRSVNAQTDQELTDIIEECRHDLICLGVKSEKTIDEKDLLSWAPCVALHAGNSDWIMMTLLLIEKIILPCGTN